MVRDDRGKEKLDRNEDPTRVRYDVTTCAKDRHVANTYVDIHPRTRRCSNVLSVCVFITDSRESI